jgi:diguanylate cyclase (GGDEF)-like protein
MAEDLLTMFGLAHLRYNLWGMVLKKSSHEFRLVAVVGLLLIPIILLGAQFVRESNKSINFAQKELVGTQYLRLILPIISKLANGETVTADEFKSSLKERSALDSKLGIEFQSSQFNSAVLAVPYNPNFALKSGRKLIADVGDHSNLILDPDLDSYYLMDVAVVQVPALLDFFARLNSIAAEPSALQLRNSENASFLLVKSQLEASFEKVKDSHARAIQGNGDGKLQLAMAPDIALFKLASEKFLSTATDASHNKTLNQGYAVSTAQFWTSTINQLEALLQKRVSAFETELYSALTISILLTLGAIAIATTVLGKLLHRMDEKILFLAHYDPMTQLKNRSSFSTEMQVALKEAANRDEPVALHLVDLDDFKSINDKYGHQTGDEVLKAVAGRLLANSRKKDLVARLGGDEFVVLQRNSVNGTKATAFANQLVSAMRDPIMIEGKAFKTSISIGTSMTPEHGATVDELTATADLALYATKAAGRNGVTVFNAKLQEEANARRLLEDEVKLATSENRFTLHYQAQFNATGEEIRGFEALLRLRGSNGENIPPNIFVPIAEQLGLITEIGAWVLNEACQIATLWPENISISVNLSPLQFAKGSISQTIAQALSKSGLKPSRLEVEITEGLLMQETDAVLSELRAIKALGVSIALDDFGSGYSSLSYLWKFPFDKLKIDRSFMKALNKADSGADNILRTIVMLGHTLNMTVTAEGVETPSQAEFMQELKCDEIQGFLYGRPIPDTELAALILKVFQAKNSGANSDAPVTIEQDRQAS